MIKIMTLAKCSCNAFFYKIIKMYNLNTVFNEINGNTSRDSHFLCIVHIHQINIKSKTPASKVRVKLETDKETF